MIKLKSLLKEQEGLQSILLTWNPYNDRDDWQKDVVKVPANFWDEPKETRYELIYQSLKSMGFTNAKDWLQISKYSKLE
jgi:hypothetical protein